MRLVMQYAELLVPLYGCSEQHVFQIAIDDMTNAVLGLL